MYKSKCDKKEIPKSSIMSIVFMFSKTARLCYRYFWNYREVCVFVASCNFTPEFVAVF